MKSKSLGYNEELQKAAVTAFADATGSDFWAEVQQHLDGGKPEATEQPLVTPRPVSVTTS